MTQLILTQSGTEVLRIRAGAVLRHDGMYVSPAVSGWSHGDYALIDAPPPGPEPEPEPPGIHDVNAERDRRLEMPFEFGGKLWQRDRISLQRITGAATLAGFAVGAGAQPDDYLWHGGSEPFGWIAEDNEVVPMDAPTVFAFGQAAAAVETRLIFAARALREMVPVPADYADNRWWG